MAEVGSAFVSILPSARGFGSKLNSEIGGDLDGAGKSAGSRFGNAMKAGALAVLGAGILAGKFLKGTLEEAREAQVVTARTENVIRKMGNASNISAAQVAKLAGSISAKTGIDDEAIQSGQNLLLTFGNIRNEAGKGNDIFNQTSKLMVDMSAAMGTDAKGSAIQLGKALNDPVKGITALTRVGVSFTEQQKAQIEKMVESGNTLGAQKVILGELERQFGGAAEAMATPADKAKVAYANLKEQIGTALLPVVDRVLNAFVASVPKISAAISGIGPLFARIGAFFAPVIAQVQGFFGGGTGGGMLASIQAFGQAIAANFLPVLQTMAATFTGVVLPAITSLATYLAAKLFPVFAQVASIITGQVLPILASFAQFFYGTIYPAVIKVATAVASNLKPVFDALVAAVQGSVLPAIQSLLVKFREWQPTIQKVIGVVVQIIGKVLEFAAAILGKVLPPVIKFAGFLLGNLIPAVANVIGILVKVAAKIIDFGQALVDAVQFAAKFAKGVVEKASEVLDWFKALPSKVLGYITGLASDMYNAGAKIVSMLAQGIKDKALEAINALKDIAGKLAALVPGSPVKDGPLRSLNDGHAGKMMMEMLAKGITDGGPRAVEAMKNAAQKMLDALQEKRDGIKSVVDQIKSDMASLSGSVASAFTGNLFEATTGADFVANLTVVKGSLKKLSAAFKKLVKWGLPAQFLSQLFSSGNGALILDLAFGSKSTAFDAFQTFGQVQSLSNQLGGQVARNQYGDELRKQTNRLERVEKAVKQVGRDVARALNQAAANAQRSAT